MNIYGVYQVLPLGYLIQQETSLQEHSRGPLNRKHIIYSIQAAATNYYRLGSLNNKHLFLMGLEARWTLIPSWELHPNKLNAF